MPKENNDIPTEMDDIYERERIRYQWMLSSVQKFRFFFAGLVFAILSFSMQFQTGTSHLGILGFEFVSWIFIGITGVFALRDCGGFIIFHNEKSFEGLKPSSKKVMWSSFIVGIVLLMLAKGLAAYNSSQYPQPNKAIQSTAISSLVLCTYRYASA